MIENIKKVQEKGWILFDNPLNSHAKTFIFSVENKNDKQRYDIYKNIENQVDNNINFKMYLRSFVKYIKEPTTLVNSEKKDPMAINIGFSKFHKLSFSLFSLFFSKIFKEYFNYFVFYHEIGHTSLHQKINNTENKYDEIKINYFKEVHSDFFALFCTLRKLTKKERVDFLNSYLKLRKSKTLSPNELYSKEYSFCLYEYFLEKENFKNMSFQEIDDKAYQFVKNLNIINL